MLSNAQSISSSLDAFQLAMVEVQEQLGAGFVIQNVCYDRNAKMWKVEFLLSENKGAFATVYLNDKGVTQRIVSGK